MIKSRGCYNDKDNDDDEGPSAGSNHGRSTKRRRSDSAASGSAQPPPKDDDQSSKKPRESDASATKQHPALTSTGWMKGMTQIWRTLTTLTFLRCRPLLGLSRFQKARDLLHPNHNGPFPRMISWNQRLTGQIHTPQRIKFLRRTSFKGRRMILGHSSNGSADEQERRSSAKLI
ncbi:hypothetical protein Tco_0657250 [Tanacetum coccineum]|uniref:Uncharacterized protein n=1 Tax=Tanacetum coccineum TaxID=301880 RepID=A0ABQ4XB94_9ASTR